MQRMLIFLIETLMFLAAGNIAVNYLWQMMSPDGAFDVMFNWQQRLDKWYSKSHESKFYRFLHDAMGGCQKCTSFWFMPFWFAAYYLVSKYAFGIWITDSIDSLGISIMVNCIWWIVFWSLGAFGGLFLILKSKKNGV